GSLVRKIDGVSDAQVANDIAIGELQPRVSTIEEEVHALTEQGVLIAGGCTERGGRWTAGYATASADLKDCLAGVRTENQELRALLDASEGNESIMVSYILWMEERITALKMRPQGPFNGSQSPILLLCHCHVDLGSFVFFH
ncbi:hypothetical protein Tco_0030654, partial [Tanacetum coccineum]